MLYEGLIVLGAAAAIACYVMSLKPAPRKGIGRIRKRRIKSGPVAK